MSFPTRPDNVYRAHLLDSAVHMVQLIRDATGDEAALCGGFLRDIILGAQPRDLDVYVPAGEAFYTAHHYMFGEKLAVIEEKDQTSPEYQHQYIERCVEAFAAGDAREKFLCLQDFPINLIGVNKGHITTNTDFGTNWNWAQAVCSRFNLTTSQMYLSQSGEVRPFSDQVIADVRNQEATILRTDWGREGTAANVRKFLAKYPTWRVFVCNDLGARYLYNEQKFLQPGGPCGRYDFDDEDNGF